MKLFLLLALSGMVMFANCNNDTTNGTTPTDPPANNVNDTAAGNGTDPSASGK